MVIADRAGPSVTRWSAASHSRSARPRDRADPGHDCCPVFAALRRSSLTFARRSFSGGAAQTRGSCATCSAISSSKNAGRDGPSKTGAGHLPWRISRAMWARLKGTSPNICCQDSSFRARPAVCRAGSCSSDICGPRWRALVRTGDAAHFREPILPSFYLRVDVTIYRCGFRFGALVGDHLALALVQGGQRHSMPSRR